MEIVESGSSAPKHTKELDPEATAEVQLIERLEEDDDVQNVFT